MAAVIAQVSLSTLTSRPKPITENVVVGKDILDLVAGSMYIDPLNVYREYIQNAADAIDEARDIGVHFDGAPGVLISFDHVERVVRIRDNGISIPSCDFVRRLITIGASGKKGKRLRGFRGVGRLSGLGYCQELVFRGRADGDAKVTELAWNGRVLRDHLRDQGYFVGLAELVQGVVTETQLPADGFPTRFFEVELRKVSRLRNDVFLNEGVVRGYLSEIAPVPFDSEFQFGSEIQKQLDARAIRAPIRIELNDGRGPVFHRGRNLIRFSDTVVEKVRDIEFVEFGNSDCEINAFGWIADHSYSGAIPKRLGLGGLRLRAGNMQVGDEGTLAELFPESRFSAWAIGDIHVLSPKIRPNGRRDDFEPSIHYGHLQGELSIRARVIAQCIRDRSVQRNRYRSVQLHLRAVDTWLQLANSVALPRMLLKIIQELSRERLEKACDDTLHLPDDSEYRNLAHEQTRNLQLLITELSSCTGARRRTKTMDNQLKLPVAAALKTILANAKTPAAGIQLSLEVLAAIEGAL